MHFVPSAARPSCSALPLHALFPSGRKCFSFFLFSSLRLPPFLLVCFKFCFVSSFLLLLLYLTFSYFFFLKRCLGDADECTECAPAMRQTLELAKAQEVEACKHEQFMRRVCHISPPFLSQHHFLFHPLTPPRRCCLHDSSILARCIIWWVWRHLRLFWQRHLQCPFTNRYSWAQWPDVNQEHPRSKTVLKKNTTLKIQNFFFWS